jgi:manganese/zinc/iron transport system substrate-binding protein
MADVLGNMNTRVPTVAVGEAVPEDRRRMADDYEGQYDPHVWFDVSLWMLVAERIRDALIEHDPQNADAYRAGAEAYLAKLGDLHAYATERIASIPEESRLLVTAHDAFGYFGDAYAVDVMGIQGISTAGEYGLQDLNRVIDVIVQREVKAVFVETSISPKSIQALVEGVRARGHDVRIGGDLYSDAMGAAGTPEGTYLGMVRHNVDTIVEALQ